MSIRLNSTEDIQDFTEIDPLISIRTNSNPRETIWRQYLAAFLGE